MVAAAPPSLSSLGDDGAAVYRRGAPRCCCPRSGGVSTHAPPALRHWCERGCSLGLRGERSSARRGCPVAASKAYMARSGRSPTAFSDLSTSTLLALPFLLSPEVKLQSHRSCPGRWISCYWLPPRPPNTEPSPDLQQHGFRLHPFCWPPTPSRRRGAYILDAALQRGRAIPLHNWQRTTNSSMTGGLHTVVVHTASTSPL